MIVTAIVGFLLGVIFLLMFSSNAETIAINEAEFFEGAYMRYEGEYDEYVDIYLNEEEIYSLHSSCTTYELIEKLSNITKGETVRIAVNPKNNFVIEIKTESETLLDAEYAQKQMRNESLMFMGLGIFVCCAAVFLIVYSVIIIVWERKSK